MSNVKIYGEHEPKTLAQMQRCMTVGSAIKGVLCADGHIGYAHDNFFEWKAVKGQRTKQPLRHCHEGRRGICACGHLGAVATAGQ